MSTVEIKPQIVVRGGKPSAVILDINDYRRLLEIAEDREDLAELSRIKRSKTYFREISEYLRGRV